MESERKPLPSFVFPGCVLVDTREQHPYDFRDLRTDAAQQHRPLIVPIQSATLRQGDYSLLGHEDCIAVERKSIEDAFGTIGQGRDRFTRELERLAELPVAAVVVEAEWSRILTDPPPFTKLPPKIVFRSVLAWQQRYPTVHWWMVPGRRLAEKVTFRILERYYKTCGSGGEENGKQQIETAPTPQRATAPAGTPGGNP